MNAVAIEPFLCQLQAQGFCRLTEIIPSGCCRTIRESVLATVNLEGGETPFPRRNVGVLHSILNHNQSFAEYLANDVLLGLVRSVLGEQEKISFTTAIINQPGNDRGGWHADWPYNQGTACHIRAPYPDALMHITTIWMLSPFRRENGATFVLPGSHRLPTNPTAKRPGTPSDGIPDPYEALVGEIQVTGEAGDVLLMDSRLWHATAPNRTKEPRVALVVRFAPWWLNLEVLRPGSEERKRMCDEVEANENMEPSLRKNVFHALPTEVKPLYRHWVET